MMGFAWLHIANYPPRTFVWWVRGTALLLVGGLALPLLLITALPSVRINPQNVFLLAHARLPALERAIHLPPGAATPGTLVPRLWITAGGEPRFFYTQPTGDGGRALFDGLTGDPLGEVTPTSGEGDFAYVYDVSQDGRQVVYWNSAPAPLHLRDLAAEREASFPVAVNGYGHSPTFSADGAFLAFTFSAAEPLFSSSAGLWALPGDTFTALPPALPDEGRLVVSNVAFSADSRYLLYVSLTTPGPRTYYYRIWDVQRGEVVAAAQSSYSTTRVGLSPGGDFVAWYWWQGVGLWSVEQGALLASILHDHGIVAASFSPDGRLLALLDSVGHVHFWGVQ